MSDRELLGLAARAAGDIPNAVIGAEPGYYWCGDTCRQQWNPLTDDGDALRLAVKLGIDVQQFGTGFVEAWKHPHQASAEDYGTDPYAATRRAIVRAAAEFGRGMGDSNVEANGLGPACRDKSR